MKNISPVNDDKDVVTKGYADGTYLPQSGGVVAAEFGGSMANFKGLEVRRTGLIQDHAAYIKFSSNLGDNGFIGMNGSGNFRVVKINDDESASIMLNLNDGRLATSASGQLLAETAIGSANGSITIENLSEYSLAWAYIDGVGATGGHFAVSATIPVAYLGKGNSVKIAGGIPSEMRVTENGVEGVKAVKGYITASMEVSAPDVLKLEISSGTIGNVQIVSVM